MKKRILCTTILLGMLCAAYTGCKFFSPKKKLFAHSDMVAISQTDFVALSSENGFDQPIKLLYKTVKEEDFETLWSLDLPQGLSYLTYEIQREGNLLIIPSSLEDEYKLLVINLSQRKILGMIDHNSIWLNFGDKSIFVCEEELWSLYDISSSTLTKRWSIKSPGDCGTHRIAIEKEGDKILAVNQDILYVLDEKDGSLISGKQYAPIIGLCKQTDELISFTKGSFTFHSLTGSKQRSVDLTHLYTPGHSMNRPFLQGSIDNQLIFIIPTDLPTTHNYSNPTIRYRTPAPYTLAGINITTGTLSWTINLGRWEWDLDYGFNLLSTNRLASDVPLRKKQLFHVLKDVPDGSGKTTGHLVYIDLSGGSLIWQADYEGATKTNILAQQRGDSFYLKIMMEDDVSRRALVLFREGVLQKALWLPDYYDVATCEIADDALWLHTKTDGSFRLDSSDLSVTASETKGLTLEDATEWVTEKLVSMPGA